MSAKAPTERSWPLARVGDICRSVNGRAFKPTEWSDRGLPIVRIQNLKNPAAPANRYSGEIADKFRVRNGDLLFAWSGTPGTSFGAHIWRGGDAVLNQHIFNLHFDRTVVDSKYFCIALNRNVADYVAKAQGGVGLAHITKGKFEDSTIPLPEIDEQRRIVAEIETQFSRLDDAVANLQRVKSNLKRYKAAVLKAAVEGRLVPTEAKLARRDGRTFESGAELLARILDTRRKLLKGHGSYREPVAADPTGLPELSNGWTWASLEQLTCLVTSGSRGWSEYYSDSGTRFIRAQDIKTDRLEFAGVARVAIPPGAEGSRSRVSTDDILVTITGANVTKSALVPRMTEPSFVSQHVGLLKLCVSACAPFVYNWIISPLDGRRILESLAYGAGKPGLSLQQLRRLVVPVPPLAEQSRIVIELDRRFSGTEDLERAARKSLAHGQALREAVLATSFGQGASVPNGEV